MKKIFIGLVFLFSLFFVANAQAILIDRGSGLIYDDFLNITWLQDADYSDTTGYDDILYGIDTDGTMYWNDAVDWADNLVYQGHDDWRLPVTPVTCFGPNPCPTSEMGNLFWGEGITASTPNPFFNVRPGAYWSGSTFTGIPWYFPFSDGSQGIDSQNPRFYAWAVREGDSTPVPEPGTIFLLGAGLAVMFVFRRKFTK